MNDGGEARASYEEGLIHGRREHARFLLRIGYGMDFAYQGERPPVEVLEEMVRLSAGEMAEELFMPKGDLEAAYFVLSSELGEWRTT